MNLESLGTVIRDVRKKAGYTQKELAEGICTQAQISKIESGKEIPSCLTLYQIAKKLGTGINYFFEMAENPRADYLQDMKYMVRKYIRERNYHEVYNLIKSERTNLQFTNLELEQFFTWHEGICAYYVENDKDKAMSKLDQAMKMTSMNPIYATEREIEILNSIGIIHNESEEYKKSIDTYKKALNLFSRLPYNQNLEVKIRILYGLSKSLTAVKQYKKSIDFIKEGIQLCIQNELMYLLGELYYQQGVNWYFLNNRENALKFMKKASMVFEIQGNYSFLEFVNNNIRTL